MILSGTVVRIESATEYTDNQQRVMVKLHEADGIFQQVRLVNEENWKIDDCVTITITKVVDIAKSEAAHGA